MSPSIKTILATLLFTCLLNLPYDYCGLFRLIVTIGFSILAYQLYHKKRQSETIVYLLLVLLFQPFYKIELGRQLWNIVDAIIGIWLLSSIFLRAKDQKNADADFTQI